MTAWAQVQVHIQQDRTHRVRPLVPLKSKHVGVRHLIQIKWPLLGGGDLLERQVETRAQSGLRSARTASARSYGGRCGACAAEHQLAHARMAVGTHHQQVRVEVGKAREDFVAHADVGCHRGAHGGLDAVPGERGSDRGSGARVGLSPCSLISRMCTFSAARGAAGRRTRRGPTRAPASRRPRRCGRSPGNGRCRARPARGGRSRARGARGNPSAARGPSRDRSARR